MALLQNNETPDSESSTGHSSAKVDMLRKLREYLDREKEMDEECRAMYTEMSPKDKEIEVMRLEDARQCIPLRPDVR